MKSLEYECCQGGLCPQHIQQIEEDAAWALKAMLARRIAGGGKTWHLAEILS